MKNLDLKENLIKKATILSTFLMTGSTMLAAATDLGNNIMATGSKLLNEVATVYCNSLGWLLLAICIIITFVSKNDKLVGWSKRGIVGAIAIYVILKILVAANGGVIGSTADTLTNWLSGK